MRKIFIALLLAATTTIANAQDFFSTDRPDKMVTFGARIGVNTSNRTVSSLVGNDWNVNAWGTGFDAGVVADLNIRDFISVQPGFFYESRSGSFAYRDVFDTSQSTDNFVYTQLGKGREYLFNIPVLAIVHFNILEDLRWNVEFGPYLQIKLKSTFDGKFGFPLIEYPWDIVYDHNVKTAKCDFGFKMGTSLDICEHYYVGVHYLAGALKAWNPSFLGGHNKAWLFSIGYNF